ncbi:MAG: metal ABC transporter permease [Phycisphaerae bacterium]|nr:metal ABC transporter permease [Phycisphaerae bacterium]
MEFVRAVHEYGFLQVALLTGLLASVACGVIGSYVVVRRITYLAGGIAHCVLGGLGAARYCSVVYGWTWLHPLMGAVAAALLAAVIIGVVSLRGRQREDTVIGALWAIGMAIGVLFIARTPGYQIDLMNYLFGNVLMVSRGELWLLAALDVLIVGIGLVFYHPFLAVCFDEEFARLRGIRVEFYYILLLCLTALTVVLLVSVVGIVMVIALLTLPVAIAGHFCKTLWQLMVASAVLSALFTTSGLALSYSPDLPAGATTILLAGVVYILFVLGAQVLRLRRAHANL